MVGQQGAAAERLLETLASVAGSLAAVGNWTEVAPDVLARLAVALDASRAYLFRVHEVSGLGLGQTCIADWAAPGLKPLTGDTRNTDEDLTAGDPVLMEWAERRRRGETISGHTRDLSGYLRDDFEYQGIRSFLSTPLIVRGVWWGHIGFDDCLRERAWTAAEVAFLRTSARLVAAAAERSDTSLVASETSRTAMLASALDAVVTIDEAGRILEFNPAAEATFGYRRDQVIGRSLTDTIVPTRHRRGHTEGFRGYIAGGRASILAQRLEIEARRADGSEFPVELTITEVRAEGRRFFTAYLRDITERRQALAALAEGEARFRALVHDQTESVTLWDTGFRCTFANRAAAELFHQTPEEHLGHQAHETIAPHVWVSLEPALRALTPEDPVYWSTNEKILPNGEVRWFEWSNRALFDERGEHRGYLSVGRDVTERRQLEARLEDLAFVDAATGLPNRNAVLKDGRADVDAAIVVRLVDFGEMTATLGRAFADRLLAVVAGRLGAAIAGRGQLARTGEKAFAVLLRAGRAEAAELSATLGETFRALFELDGRRVLLRAAIGIAHGGDGIERLLLDAEMAGHGERPGTIERFDAVMRTRQLERLEIEAALRDALDRRQDEIRVAYQPIVDLPTGRLVGFEALARWRHPTRGEVPPAVFIPIAEATGLILPLGERILESAVEEAARWRPPLRGNGVPLFVAVNLSAHQCADPELIDRVKRIFARSAIDPQMVKFELTESTLMSQAEPAVDVLHRLRELGSGLAIDDFGTGYSSLSYLHRFPIDNLKIDRSFVSRMLRTQADREIVRVMIDLAHGLGLSVVAEGIETPDMRDALVELGCDHGQGYLLGRPMPARAAAAMVAEAA